MSPFPDTALYELQARERGKVWKADIRSDFVDVLRSHVDEGGLFAPQWRIVDRRTGKVVYDPKEKAEA